MRSIVLLVVSIQMFDIAELPCTIFIGQGLINLPFLRPFQSTCIEHINKLN